METPAGKTSYPSDLNETEWAILDPLIPRARQPGRPEKHPKRTILNAIFYLVRSGCAWRMLPDDLPPWRSSSTAPNSTTSNPAPPLGRRTHLRLARPLPPAQQGLRALRRIQRSLPLSRHAPPPRSLTLFRRPLRSSGLHKPSKKWRSKQCDFSAQKHVTRPSITREIRRIQSGFRPTARFSF